MIKKFMVSSFAALILVGSTQVLADCPTYFNSNEAEPCHQNSAPAPVNTTPAVQPGASKDAEQHNANAEAWRVLAQSGS